MQQALCSVDSVTQRVSRYSRVLGGAFDVKARTKEIRMKKRMPQVDNLGTINYGFILSSFILIGNNNITYVHNFTTQ